MKIQSINRAFDILEFLAGGRGSPKSLGDIVRETGINPTTASNILKTMAGRNYIEQAGPRKGYSPGVMCYFLSRNIFYYNELVRIAAPHMESFVKSVGETVLIAVLKRGSRYTLHRISGEGVFEVRRDIIYGHEVIDTATGRVLLADLSLDDLNSFARERGVSGEELASLAGSIGQIRKDGFCVHATHGKQVAGIACPVRLGGKTAASLGTFLPVFRFRGVRRKRIIEGLKSVSKQISDELSIAFGEEAER